MGGRGSIRVGEKSSFAGGDQLKGKIRTARPIGLLALKVSETAPATRTTLGSVLLYIQNEERNAAGG